ncbi:hypothetical protein KGO06_01705 [Patescibacteria group bacterium]|nr:hypothetical protein [Patescibacteria group bacterium]
MSRSFLTALLDLFLPRHARALRARAINENDLRALVAPRTLPRAPWIHALLPYTDERVRAIVQSVKYHREHEVAARIAPLLASELTHMLHSAAARDAGWQGAIIVPIPASSRRLRERGYVQAALYARALKTHLPHLTANERILTRQDRVSQVRVSRAERQTHVRGAFRASHAALGAYIVLIDDVVQSGATLIDARRALLDEGARGVLALAVAH